MTSPTKSPVDEGVKDEQTNGSLPPVQLMPNVEPPLLSVGTKVAYEALEGTSVDS